MLKDKWKDRCTDDMWTFGCSCNNVAPVTNLCLGRATTRSHSSQSDGLLVDDTKEKAEILNRQYFSVFTPENTDEQLPPLNDNFQSMPEISHHIRH